MRRAIYCAVLLLSCCRLRAQSADAQLEGFFKKYLEEHCAMRPLDATRLGDHRFDHLLDDVSKTSRARWVEHERRTLKELPTRVNYSKLTRAGQIDFEIFKHELERSIWLA